MGLRIYVRVKNVGDVPVVFYLKAFVEGGIGTFQSQPSEAIRLNKGEEKSIPVHMDIPVVAGKYRILVIVYDKLTNQELARASGEAEFVGKVSVAIERVEVI